MAERARARRRAGAARPSMADVARVAGVSAQTVSRTLSGHPNVTAATRDRVLSAVSEIGYRPNNAARALSTGRTRTLGVVTQDEISYSRVAISHGIDVAAREAGYFVTFAAIDPSLGRTADAIARLVDQGVDGIIAAVNIAESELAEVMAHRVPTVMINAAHTPGTVRVVVEQQAAGHLATDHLLGLGHRTVWHLAGPVTTNPAGRTAGWEAALRKAGREVPPSLHGDWSPASGYGAGSALAANPDVTAVFVASDEMAFGVLRAMADHGRRVPDDVSVVGMDDIALAEHSSPPLTTVRQPFVEVGMAAVQVVLDGARAPVTIAPELVVRASTSPPT